MSDLFYQTAKSVGLHLLHKKNKEWRNLLLSESNLFCFQLINNGIINKRFLKYWRKSFVPQHFPDCRFWRKGKYFILHIHVYSFDCFWDFCTSCFLQKKNDLQIFSFTNQTAKLVSNAPVTQKAQRMQEFIAFF